MISTFYSKQNKDDIEDLKYRNELLLEFFHLNAISKIRILGNAYNPMVIYDDRIKLACYVRDFNLILLENVNENKIISTFALDTDTVLNAEGILLDFLHNSTHASAYKIRLKQMPNLYLSGYAYLDVENRQGKEPTFCSINPRILLSKSKTEEIVRKMNKYDLEII